MTLVASTLLAVVDAFQRKEGVWQATRPFSYRLLDSALRPCAATFAEWDPERGLYFVDLSPLDDEEPTLDVLAFDFRGGLGSDHFRFEWTASGTLSGVELQTHAPGPLPFVTEIAEWLEPGDPDRSPALTLEAWSGYLEGLHPETPLR